MQITNLIQNQTFSGFVLVFLIATMTVLINTPDANLEQRVNDLENRVDTLEEAVLENSTSEETGDVEVSEDKSLSRENWRKLETGMKKDEVRELLGEPRRIDGGSDATWHYGFAGTIYFDGKRVRSWREPM